MRGKIIWSLVFPRARSWSFGRITIANAIVATPGYALAPQAPDASPDSGYMNMPSRARKAGNRASAPIAASIVVLLALPLAACGVFSESFQRGYVVPEGALEQIHMGASQEQVLIVLGTPSTVATVSGEAFYYISQRSERAASFMPQRMVDQRVVAVYFDKSRRVQRIADYGLQDGKVFDFVSRTTPTSSREANFLQSLFSNMNFGVNPFGH
jgi:outer membrane protein assembly factor BamE (lipoprotein component of BamABCDE complex)